MGGQIFLTAGTVAMIVAMPIAAVAASTGGKGLRPEVTSLTAYPILIPVSGGKTSVRAGLENATTCLWSGEWAGARQGVTVKPTACGGEASTAETWTLPANSTGANRTWVVYFIAKGPGGTSRWAHISITQLGGTVYGQTTTATTTTGIPSTTLGGYLDECSPGPTCDYGPINDSFLAYGNTAPTNLGDCTFAAAADLIQIMTGNQPDPTEIGVEFADAGGGTNGLSLPQLMSYWENDGIAGVTITGYASYYPTEIDVENAVPQFHALLAELLFGSQDFVGPIAVSAGYHLAVVDGFTPEGPLVVTWGQTIQMTWQQWNAEATGLYAVQGA